MITNVVILAAGKGSRMKSRDENVSKVAYPILGKPMINYVVDVVKELKPKNIITVVGFGGEVTKKCVEQETKVVWQHELLGTGHAIRQTASLINKEEGLTLVVCGDTPLITKATLDNAINKHIRDNNKLTILTSVLENPNGYGRIIRQEKSNDILAIREEKACSEYELDIGEVNAGVYVFDNQIMFKYLAKQEENNKEINDFNVTELVKMLVEDKLKVGAYVLIDPVDIYTIDDRMQLAYAAKVIKKRTNLNLMLSGVTIEDISTAYISPEVTIGKDTIIRPNTTIIGKTVIGEGNIIGPNSYIEDSIIGNENEIVESRVIKSKISDKKYIGPYQEIKGE